MTDNPLIRIAAAIAISAIFLAYIISFLPEIPFPPEFSTALTWVFQTLWSFDFIIPAQTLITCFGLVLLSEMTIMSLKVVFWLKKHLTQQH